MARVRNLYYNGTMVEQPVYNGVNLTKWIHDGVVVWEQGSAVIEVPVTQISVPQYYDVYDGLAYMAYDGTYLYYLYHYEVTSPRMTNLRCYRVPYSNPSDTPTLLWALDDTSYSIFSDTYPWFMNILVDDNSKWLLIKPWDFANKLQISGDGGVLVKPTYYSNYFITTETYGLQRKIRQKSDFSVVSSFSTSLALDFDHTIVLSTSEIVEFSASGYRVFNSSGTQTGSEVFTKAMISVPVYFNGNFVGVIDEIDAYSNHHYKLVRYSYGANDYVEILDLESENLVPDSYALSRMKSTYNVDYNGQYVAIEFAKGTTGNYTEVFLLIDTSFTVYMTSSLSTSGEAHEIQMIGNYIICPDVPTIFEIDFSSLQQAGGN